MISINSNINSINSIYSVNEIIEEFLANVHFFELVSHVSEFDHGNFDFLVVVNSGFKIFRLNLEFDSILEKYFLFISKGRVSV